jgi:hypothetical protein
MTEDAGTDETAPAEPTREELLENSPEAVAMRRARAARAEAAAQAARAPARPAPRRITRRGVLLGVLGGVGAARVISGLAGRRGP